MIKNAIIYRIVGAPVWVNAALEDALQAAAFTPCGSLQDKSVGWVPPRGEEHGVMLENIGGFHILKLMTETKAVPASAVKLKVDEQVKQIEATTGRKPGRKETRDLKDDARMALLPLAFPVRSATTIIIDFAKTTLILDAGSQSKADTAITALIKVIDGLALQLVQTGTSPAAAMSLWLGMKESPNDFTVDQECELKAVDGSKAVVKYGRHPLDIDEVAQHIAGGKVPTKLALTWNERVSFVLTGDLQLKKIQFLGVAVAEHKEKEHADRFDADVAIVTGELSKLIPALIGVLGGESQQ